jgi:hypothetical protein
MTDAQTVFTILYGLYFAAIVTLTGRFQPFDTPSMYKLKGRAWFRMFISLFLLDFLPLGYFVLVLNWLSKVKNFPINFWSMLALLMLSLTGFGFYRIYFGVMLIKYNKKSIFYGDKLPITLEEELNKRDESHREWIAHVIPGIVWILVTTMWGGLWILLHKP